MSAGGPCLGLHRTQQAGGRGVVSLGRRLAQAERTLQEEHPRLHVAPGTVGRAAQADAVQAHDQRRKTDHCQGKVINSDVRVIHVVATPG